MTETELISSPLFSIVKPVPPALERLNAQQAGQLAAALNYHSLRNPGAKISYRIAIGDLSQVPELTDRTTSIRIPTADDEGFATLEAISRAVGQGPAGNDVAPLVRHLQLSHPDATPATVQPPAPLSLPRTVYRQLEKRTPVLLDTAREAITRRREQSISRPLPRFPDAKGNDEIIEVAASWDRTPERPPHHAPPAILFGLHWLQTGGAERWAVETIQIAKDAGFLPVIVTDQNSVHPWITRPEFDDCVIITLSFCTNTHTFDVALAHALLENFDLRGIVLHHCNWLYQALPWIRQQRPDIPVVSSLHIVEYLRGGYPGISVTFDEFIDTHHVISPHLVDWMTGVQGVEETKLHMAPLTKLTVDETQHFEPRDPSRPFVIGYLARLSRQKRPDLFLALVHRLRRSGLVFRAIMHGDGEMRDVVDGLIDQFDLRGVIEQRFEDTPADDTLRDADLLIVTSINEGLTLTTFEALAAGIPVLSTDVGSQRTLVQGDLLLPRPARRFLPLAVKRIRELSASEALRERVWTEQVQRMAEFAGHTDAHHFMKEQFEQWLE